MKILIVGGAGVIGGDAALHFRKQGHDVTIAGRNAPPEDSPLSVFPFERIDYVANNASKETLSKFEALIFCAGNDTRHMPEGSDLDHWRRVNSVAIPRFFETAKEAGIKVAINVGSYYPQASPDLLMTNQYVRSRLASDEGVCALNDENFRSMSINAPYVLGPLPGVVSKVLKFYVKYFEGLSGMEVFAPPGATNFITTTSLTQAMEGALLRGVGGTSYLVGDANWTYQEYFGAFTEALGKPTPPILDKENPVLPDSAIFGGRGSVISYETDPEETKLLGYKKNDCRRIIQEAVEEYRSR